MEPDTFNYLVAVLCAVGGFSCVAWKQPVFTTILFVLALVNVALAVFTP